MDSYSLHFERMSNLDLHPLGLPVSLSPAKSTSSIDQYTHHHGKGDSAYSSFSGGSTAPDYPSPFLPDDFHPHNLHYADLKYVKAVYGPSILESDSKSMDQLYRSMEVIAQPHQHHQHNNGCLNIKDSQKLSSPLIPPPPPPPVRLDSFITTRNLETSRARQSPEGQLADISSLHTQKGEALSLRPDPVYGHGVVQHYQRDQLKQDTADNIPESKSATTLGRLHLQTSQSEQMKGGPSEIQQKRLHSADGVSVTDQQRVINSWHKAQSTISRSIQHKGQFYFVTGVYKSLDSNVPQPPCAVEIFRTESHKQAEQQRSHSTMENMFKNAEVRKQSSSDGPNGQLFFQAEKKVSTTNDNTSNFCKSEKVSQIVDGLEESQRNMDIGRYHTANHPIFYCGPEKASDTSQNKFDHYVNAKKEDPVDRQTRHPLAEVPTEKISKEATPLLYHLTGANRAPNKVKNENNSTASRDPERGRDKQKARKESSHTELSKEEKLNEFSYPCNTLDDSFKKYYKEKLKDAQSKVLRETSFKRKDLQLFWPNRAEQWSDKRLSVVPSSLPLQDVHSKLENPIQAHLLKFQETDKEPLRNPGQETVKQQNIPEPQVPRIGSRKRLTPEQKKLSHSEPEKLHKLADRPIHATCRSLGSESEVLLCEEPLGEHGIVAARRKMFETRGRALSASSLSKSSLKQLQHTALVAYMERKTGHKVAEPQQPSQRPSAAGRQSDWGPRPYSANAGSKKKLLRPHSAGRILDSSSRSSQFSYAQPVLHSCQSSWKEGSLPPSGKSASVENLLDEQPASYRSRSTSTPQQIHIHNEFPSAHDKDIQSTQIKVGGETPLYKHYAESVPDQRRMRVMAARGKSLEELGVAKLISPKPLSKSSEQLHQLCDEYTVSSRGKRDLPLFIAQRKPEQDRVPPASEKNIQVEPCSLDQPITVLSRVCDTSSSPGSEAPAHATRTLSCDDKPPVILQSDGCNGREGKVTSAACSPGGTSENLGHSKITAVPQEQSSLKTEEPLGHEVSLSLGVTTDPSLWILPSEIDDHDSDEGIQQNVQPASCTETTPESSASDADLSPAVGEDQEGKSEEDTCGSPATEKPEENFPEDQPGWEILVTEVVSADQSLTRILYPITSRKTALMLMEQLLSEDTLLMEEHYKKKLEQQKNKAESSLDSPEMADNKVDDSLPPQRRQCDTAGNITEKKKQLIVHIEERLKSLESLRSSLQSEERENRVRGDAFQALVRECCVPTELERYTQFIGDLERVVNLLLCLSARLARVQNALSTVDENTDAEEKQSLDNRHELLCKQREDAKDLKENLDRRERMVSTFLAKQLTDAQLQEYRRFVQNKASLLLRHKDLEEKQRLGEEQLEALLNSIPP